MNGFLEGRREAIDALVETCYARVYSLACRVLQDRDAANDVAQETFLRVFDKIGKFRFKSSLLTWVLSITYNLCLDRIQLSKKMTIMDVEYADKADAGTDDMNDKYLQEQKLEEIERAIQLLEPHERVMIELHYLNGCSVREISVILQKSETASKTALFRAREKLRTLVIKQKNYEFN